jgi:hypothetical protein
MSQEKISMLVQGRIIWKSGDLFKGQPQVDYNTKAPKLDKMGKQAVQYGFGLAVPKVDQHGQPNQQLQALLNTIHDEARKLYQSGVVPPAFAYKYKDGDTAIDEKGMPYNIREGYAGHVVFAATTLIAIRWFKYENGGNIAINEGVKNGDYVNVALDIKAHTAVGQGKPGMYLNPSAVQLVGYGKEIVNVPQGDSFFGLAAPVVPMGASTIPVAPNGGVFTPPPTQAPNPYHNVLPTPFQPPVQNQAVPQQQAAPTPFPFPTR